MRSLRRWKIFLLFFILSYYDIFLGYTLCSSLFIFSFVVSAWLFLLFLRSCIFVLLRKYLFGRHLSFFPHFNNFLITAEWCLDSRMQWVKNIYYSLFTYICNVWKLKDSKVRKIRIFFEHKDVRKWFIMFIILLFDNFKNISSWNCSRLSTCTIHSYRRNEEWMPLPISTSPRKPSENTLDDNRLIRCGLKKKCISTECTYLDCRLEKVENVSVTFQGSRTFECKLEQYFFFFVSLITLLR